MSKIESVILKLNKLRNLHEEMMEIARDSVPIASGNLRDNGLEVRPTSDESWELIIDPVNPKTNFHYAKAIIYGRGPITAKGPTDENPFGSPYLDFEGYDGAGTSIHHGDAGKHYRVREVGPSIPNDFRRVIVGKLVQRARQIMNE